MMPDIFEYLNYRSFLRDCYDEKRKSGDNFTHRTIGKSGGFDPGLFSKVITGQRNISDDMIPKFCTAFSLNKKETAYFELLVHFDQEPTLEGKRKFLDQIFARGSDRIKTVEKKQYDFYENWYSSAFRELLHYFPFNGDYEQLAKKLIPPVTPGDAKKAIRLLETLGFIALRKDGSYALKDSIISSGFEAKSVAIDNFNLQCIDLAKRAFEQLERDTRSFSTLTFSLPMNQYSAVVDKIRAFRKDLLDFIARNEGQDSVYQLNIQLFPLSLPDKSSPESGVNNA